MNSIVRVIVSLMLLCAVNQAQALGLGEARVASDLSSPLLIEIPLVGVGSAGLSPEEIRVDVPGIDEHARLGALEPIFPRDARVKATTDARGRTIVRITTQHATREPALRFVLRASSKGSVAVREYELLVDPPAVAMPRPRVQGVIFPARTLQPLRAGRASRRTVPRAGTSYGPVVDGDTVSSIVSWAYPRFVNDARRVAQFIVERNPRAFIGGDASLLLIGARLDLPEASIVASALPAARTRPPAPRVALRSAPAPARASGGAGYTVKSGDTLYGIARNMTGASGAALAAAVNGLFEANPNAFLGGNRDHLRVGTVLSLDTVPRAATAARGQLPGVAAQPVPVPVPVPAPTATQPTPAVAMTTLTSDAEVSDAATIVTPESLTVLRDELATVEAAVEQERNREGELRARLERVIEQAAALREREARLSEETEALHEQIARQMAQAEAALTQPPAAVKVVTPGAVTPSATPIAVPDAASPQVASATGAATGVTGVPPVVRREPGVLYDVRTWLSDARTWLGGAAARHGRWLTGGAGVLVLLLLALVLRKRRSVPEVVVQAETRPDEEAVKLRIAEVREYHDGLRTGDFTEDGEVIRTAEGRKVVMTDAAAANNLAKEAAVHMAYGDLESSKACIMEAVRLDPKRDEHKMMLITVYESTNEHARARAIVEDLLSRREQLSSEIRAQVESKLRKRAAR